MTAKGEHRGTEKRGERRARTKPLESEDAGRPKSRRNERWARGEGRLLGRESAE